MPSAIQIALGLAGVVALGVGLTTQSKLPSFRSSSTPAQADLLPHRYLSDRTRPDSLTIIPPPPAPGSAAMARDVALRRAALAFHGTARYAIAVSDSDRSQESTAKAFECALGTRISRDTTPTLYRLLARLRLDVRASTYPAKEHYRRARPYVANNAQVCAPVGEGFVRDDGSYPSARGAVGWSYALVLAELQPARRAAIMERGREFGQSRVICDAEWQSDVDAGRVIAAAAVREMHQDGEFMKDMQAARKEIRVSTSGRRAEVNCPPEPSALASR